jgi:uncharacterized membrane protein YoaK (UPF0700 family)
MPLSSEGTARTFRQNVTLAVLLASVAGAINAVGFFAFGLHTSHMTGQAATVGEALARGELAVASGALKMMLAFVAGAATAAALLDLTSARKRGRYTPALAVEVLVLAASALWALRHHGLHGQALVWALSFAMGLQNALVTRISGAVVRTTHQTGVLTDFGIELIHVLRLALARLRQRGGLRVWQDAAHLMFAAELQREWLHLALVGSFLTGATAGSMLWLHSNEVALAVPCVVLMALILLDWRPNHPASVTPTTEHGALHAGPARPGERG